MDLPGVQKTVWLYSSYRSTKLKVLLERPVFPWGWTPRVNVGDQLFSLFIKILNSFFLDGLFRTADAPPLERCRRDTGRGVGREVASCR